MKKKNRTAARKIIEPLRIGLFVIIFTFLVRIPSISGAEERKIPVTIPNQTVRVGLFQLQGYHDCHNGEPVGGYGYDYLQQIRRYAPFVYEYHCMEGDWNSAYQMLEAGKIDLLTNVRKTPEREAQFAFSKRPIGQSSSILTVKSGNLRFHSGEYTKWNGIRIGVLKNNHWEKKLTDYTRAKGFTCKTIVYDDEKTLFQDLQKARNIDAILSNNLRRLDNEWILEQFDALPFYIAVRKECKDILAKLDVAMAQLELNEPGICSILWQKYFSGVQAETVIYTENEIAFIQEMRKSGRRFTAVLNPDRYPISYHSSQGPRGFIKEIVDEIFRRTGIDVDFLPIKTPEECRAAHRNPKVDIICDAKYNLREAEEMGLCLSRPYITLSAFMLCNKKTCQDLKSLKKVVLIDGYRIAEQIRPLLPNDVQIQYCRTSKEAIDLVVSGECDGTCLHTTAAEYAVRNDPYGRLSTMLLLNTHIDLSVGTRDSLNPLLGVIINKAVASIGNEYIAHSVQKYKLPPTTFSLVRLFYGHPILVLGTPLLVLFVICLSLWSLLVSRKKTYRLGAVIERMPFRYYFADTKGRILQYDYGQEQEHPHLTTIDDLPDETARLSLKRMTAKTLESGEAHEEIYLAAGRIRTSVVYPVPKSMFGCPAVIVISRDITELQKSLEKADRNEEYFRLTLQSIGDGVITTDKKGNVIMLNPVAERMIGVTLSEAQGEPHTNFFRTISYSDGCELESPVHRTLRTGRSVELTNHTILLSLDGKNRYHISSSCSPILDDKSNILGAILVFRNMTEEYQRNEEIQEDIANWEAASRIAEIYHYKYDPNTKIISGSHDIDKVWPTVNGQAIDSHEWIYSEDYPEWLEHFTKVVEGKEKQATIKYRIVDNGHLRYFRGFLQAASHPGGEIIGLIQEVTSFVEYQQKANALKNLWSTCLESMPVGLSIKSIENESHYIMVNTFFAQMVGRSVEDVIGRRYRDLFQVPEEIRKSQKNDLMAIEQNRPIEFMETITDLNGKTHHFRTVKVPSIGLDGKPVLMAIALDETEDYNRSQKTKTLLEDWENAAKIARIANYRLDSQLRPISTMKSITDFWPLQENGDPVSPEEYLHPDDVDPFIRMYQSVYSGHRSQSTMLCRVPRPEGTRYLRLFIKKISEQPTEIGGLIQDVTVQTLEQKKRSAFLSMWKNVVDTIPVLFFVKNADDDFRYLQVNRNFCEQFGLERDDIIGKTEKGFLTNPEEAQQNTREDLQVIESGKHHIFVKQIHVKDGVIRHFQTVKVPSVDENGQRILIAMAQDITEAQEQFEMRKIITTAFETLFVSDDLEADLQVILRDICEFIGFDRAYICRIDETTNSLQVFTAYRRTKLRPLFDTRSFRVDQVSSQLWYKDLNNSIHNDVYRFDFSNQNDREIAKDHVPHILERAAEFDIHGVHLNYIVAKGKPWGSIGFITGEQAVKNLSAHQTRLLQLTGHIVEIAITRQQTMEQLKLALANTLAADKAKNFFLSSMSHEIRTPLNAVIGFADLLKDPDLDQESREDYLNSISLSSHALLTLLNDILELSKLTSGNVEFHPVLLNINNFVTELDDLYRPLANQKDLTLQIDTENVPNLYLDPPALRQICFNLISNAIKFTHKGGVRVGMEYKPKTSEVGELVLIVSDTGIGIAPEDREKMFEPFIQMSRMRGTNALGSGTGLGVPIVKKLVEHLGGTLELDSQIDRGSTFTITLPNVGLHAESLPNKQKEAISPGSSFEKHREPGKDALENKPVPHVLIVDDSEMTLEILSRMLTWLHVPFKKASSAKDALDLLKQESFDIVITDLLMADMNGVELATAIRAVPQYEKIRIFAMSTEDEPIMYNKDLFNNVMLKPVIRSALYDCLFGVNRNEE